MPLPVVPMGDHEYKTLEKACKDGRLPDLSPDTCATTAANKMKRGGTFSVQRHWTQLKREGERRRTDILRMSHEHNSIGLNHAAKIYLNRSDTPSASATHQS